MASGKVKSAVAGVLIAGAALSLYFCLYEPPPLGDPKPHEVLGQALAQEAANLLGSGGRINLIVRDTSIFQNPATDFQIKGFLAAAKKLKLSVGATNLVKLDPLRVVRVPPSDFLDILRRQKEGDVLVSFLGPSVLGSDQRAQLGEKKPRVVAFCPGEMARQIDLRALFDLDLLRAVVISRVDPPLKEPLSADSQTWFKHYYQLITPLNLSELPLPASSRPQ
jgi:hypothetical protein